MKTPQDDSISIKGIIIDEIPGYCGLYCNGGMIKVKLDKKFSLKDMDTIYIITACITTKGYKGKKIDVKATKLVDTDKECYYRYYSRLDNYVGLTYKLSEQESKRI